MDYYSNLLALEYHGKPKATATIEALTNLLPHALIQSVINAFDIETAVGVQLETLGQYVDVDRFYLLDGVLQRLSDDDYRTLIKLKAISNTSDLSHKSLDESLYKFFGYSVRMDSAGDMKMTYFVPKNKTALIQAAIQKQVLPRPEGVQCNYIIEYDKNFFAFCRYTDLTTAYKAGFRSYDNPDKPGEVLTYYKRVEFEI